MSVVKVDLPGGQQITSSVTKQAVDELGLTVGSPVTVVIKSTEVMLAVD
jgi:molybdopterin-binding protein